MLLLVEASLFILYPSITKVKTVLYYTYLALKKNTALFLRRLKRLLNSKPLSEAESFALPIIINNYNRLSDTKNLIDWLIKAGYTNVIVLDNNSTYPPLLAYYKTCAAKVVYLKKNLKFKALWQIPLFDTIKKSHYVYTDSDVYPTATCPANIVFQLYQLAQPLTCEKIGPALQIDDLPDWYAHKQKVIDFEKAHWQKPLGNNLYDAPIDTTFALYKPYAHGAAEECKGIRVAGSFLFKHKPWYVNSNALNEEELFYKLHIEQGATMWSEK